MPEMPLVSTHAECAPVKSMPDVHGGSRSSHDPCARSVPSPEMSARNVSAKVSTTKVSAAMTTAVSAAVSRGSIGGER